MCSLEVNVVLVNHARLSISLGTNKSLAGTVGQCL